jgi:ankyrin repeat protein
MSNPFLEAAKAGDLPTIKLMLAESPERITEVDETGGNCLLHAAEHGQLETVMWLLREGGASVGEVDEDGNTALIVAANSGQLETVMWLLMEGGANIGEANNYSNTALIFAAYNGQLETVQWLLTKGSASIGDVANDGWTALLAAACRGKLATVQYLLEHGDADIGDTLRDGDTIWDMIFQYLIEGRRVQNAAGDKPYVYDATAVTSLLRVMVLRGAPLAERTARLSREHAQVVTDGARLRAGLPAYLAQRQALLDAHCPLISPLCTLVHGYEEPTTTDELWATGLGAARQGAVRPRADDGAADAAVPLRRSLRLRQKRE